MGEEILIIIPLSLEDNGWHLLDNALAIVPHVQRVDQVAPHDEVEGVGRLVLRLEPVH